MSIDELLKQISQTDLRISSSSISHQQSVKDSKQNFTVDLLLPTVHFIVFDRNLTDNFYETIG